ncbi:MAG: GNAT family N-acetyltransferase [Alphaproteobacteria bacterium]
MRLAPSGQQQVGMLTPMPRDNVVPPRINSLASRPITASEIAATVEMFRVLPETPDDSFEVEMLLDLAFAPGRTALSSYQLREGVAEIAELSTIVRDEYDSVVGAIRYWPVRVGAAGDPALLLGPIAIHPTRQGEGLGALLMMESLERARAMGWRRVVLVGDEPYYRRFGFTREMALALDFPKPVNLNRLLAKELVEGAMQAVSGMVTRWELGDEQEKG